MAKQRKRKRIAHLKNMLAIAAVVAVVAVIGLVAGFSWQEKYDDGYFVSDDTKLVITTDKNIASFEDGEYEPELTHVVYYYGGDNINGMKVFFAYDDVDEAKEANENITLEDKNWATNKKLVGKYIVFETEEGRYKDLKTDDVRDLIGNMKAAGTMYEPKVYNDAGEEVVDVAAEESGEVSEDFDENEAE